MTTGLAWIASGLLLASGALAQTSRPATEPQGPSGDKPLLAGPTVEPAAHAEIEGRGRRDARRRLAVPPRMWFRFVNELDLEPEQQRQIRAMTRDLQNKNREFQRGNGAEIAELQRAARELAAAGDPQDAAELRRQMQELRATAPRIPEYQQRIWDLLTEAQQDALRKRLAEERRQIAERQSDRRVTDGEAGDMELDERRLRPQSRQE